MSSYDRFMARRIATLKKRMYNLSQDCTALLESMYPIDARYYEDTVRNIADFALEAYFELGDDERSDPR